MGLVYSKGFLEQRSRGTGSGMGDNAAHVLTRTASLYKLIFFKRKPRRSKKLTASETVSSSDQSGIQQEHSVKMYASFSHLQLD